jgi:hypothetical protein
MRKTICDFCGEQEIEFIVSMHNILMTEKGNYYLKRNIKKETELYKGTYPHKVDICSNCVDKIISVINGIKKVNR